VAGTGTWPQTRSAAAPESPPIPRARTLSDIATPLPGQPQIFNNGAFIANYDPNGKQKIQNENCPEIAFIVRL
jgi:hypothetical protein